MEITLYVRMFHSHHCRHHCYPLPTRKSLSYTRMHQFLHCRHQCYALPTRKSLSTLACISSCTVGTSAMLSEHGNHSLHSHASVPALSAPLLRTTNKEITLYARMYQFLHFRHHCYAQPTRKPLSTVYTRMHHSLHCRHHCYALQATNSHPTLVVINPCNFGTIAKHYQLADQ